TKLVQKLSKKRDIYLNKLNNDLYKNAHAEYILKIDMLDELIADIEEEFGTISNTSEEYQPIGKAKVIEALIANNELEKAKALKKWRNRKNTHFGWGGWFQTEYGVEFAKKYGVDVSIPGRKKKK